MKIGVVTGMLAAGAAAMAWAPVHAGAVRGTLEVSARVEAACHLDLRPVRFAASLVSDGGAEADSALAVACTPETAFVVSMDDGQHRAAGGRRLAEAAGAGYLAYELYSDAARTRRWGASLAESVGGQMRAAGTVTLPIYARLETARAGVGSYSDVVTVTVSF